MKTITYKSTPENWIKEHNDVKRCTVRKIYTEYDIRIEICREWIKSPFLLRLELENTISHDISAKIVKDVTEYENRMIISW